MTYNVTPPPLHTPFRHHPVIYHLTLSQNEIPSIHHLSLIKTIKRSWYVINSKKLWITSLLLIYIIACLYPNRTGPIPHHQNYPMIDSAKFFAWIDWVLSMWHPYFTTTRIFHKYLYMRSYITHYTSSAQMDMLVIGLLGLANGAFPKGITMTVCTLRVIEALCKLKDQLIIWPNQDKRKYESMKNSDREGFLGAVGKLDDTDIVLKFKPGGIFKGGIFFNRKKRYALDLCTICDSSKRFTYILAGWPNSQHDARIFASTSIHRNPRRYFSPGEYLLGDAAYSNTSYLIGPYKSPYTREKSNRRFNRKLSSVLYMFWTVYSNGPSTRWAGPVYSTKNRVNGNEAHLLNNSSSRWAGPSTRQKIE